MIKKINCEEFVLNILGTLDGKRARIIEYVLHNLTENCEFIGTYDQIAKELRASKPTVVNTFKKLRENNVLVRLKNGRYRVKSDLFNNSCTNSNRCIN
ncbi:MAG: replication/maintenance protein RepL [Sulfurospirillaceae bacterium]|nr:replication/maintenance protein RepL [Sulfurospirillaceae bacterium]MDD3463171.1 replication/maintenance protein RepL [Sulfurospirillaceae bacterium]